MDSISNIVFNRDAINALTTRQKLKPQLYEIAC